MVYIKAKEDFDNLSESSIDEIGEKAFSLLKIPADWTPPFFILTTGFFSNYFDSRHEKIVQIEPLKPSIAPLNHRLNELKQLGYNKVIVRSSATIETMQDRGNFESIDCNNDLSIVLQTVEKIFLDTYDLVKENKKNNLALIIQGFVVSRLSGHLSNERRISKGLDSWSIEYINHKTNECDSETFKVSDNKLPLEEGQLSCSKRDDVINKLKRLAFNTYSQEKRSHFEWVWDGSRLWIVQKDVETTEPGSKPGSNWKYTDIKIDHSSLKVLTIDKNCKEQWSKIKNIETFRACELPSVVFFVLEDLGTKEKLLRGERSETLVEDLKILCRYPVVIRTSLIKDNLAEGLYLPRTDTIFDWPTAERFIIDTIRKVVLDDKLDLSSFSFLIHHFIVSKSCALVYSIPNRNKVRIDSSWGLADGLAYNSYDSFDVDLGTKKIKKKIRGKHEYLDVDEAGNWIIKKSGSNWDWKPSLDDKEVISIAEMSYRISTHSGKSLIIMFFINYPNSKIHAHILPWHLIPEIPKFSETISEKMFSRNKITISTKKDFEILKRRYNSGNMGNDKITIHLKLDPKILRDSHFIKEIGTLAKEANFHLEIEGSTLSHVYYILSNQGVKVRCFDLFEPRYEKQTFNKLVRDKIPEKISSHGESSVVSKIPRDLLIELLKAKVVEEALELQNSPDQKNLLEELADVLEIVRSISNVIKTPISEIEKLADKKREERGGFEEGVYLRETEEISITNFKSKKKKLNQKISLKSFRGQKVKLEENKVILSLIPSIIKKEPVVLFFKNLNKYVKVQYKEKEVVIFFEDNENIPNINPSQLNLFGDLK